MFQKLINCEMTGSRALKGNNFRTMQNITLHNHAIFIYDSRPLNFELSNQEQVHFQGIMVLLTKCGNDKNAVLTVQSCILSGV
jgi:hypothetical protein